MKRILDLVDERQRIFAELPFFVQMRNQAPYASISGVVPQLAFWILTFHDLLELAEARMVDPHLRQIVRHHRSEESGHDVWYLDDLASLGVPLPGIVELFGPVHQRVRRGSYRLMAEAIRSESDWVRIALVLTMEATGAVFFAHASRYAHWPVERLLFFSNHHLQVEQAHELFEQRMHDFLRAQELNEVEYVAAQAAVLRSFEAFHHMFEGTW